MRFAVVVTIGCAGCLALGCQERVSREEAGRRFDMELVNTLNNVGVEQAILAQHTLYPYHFVVDGEELNELGRRDLAVLARHFRQRAGTLNIRPGEVPAQLYEARVVHVAEGLRQAGVEADRVNIADGMAGGDGMSSERAVIILAKTIDGAARGGSYSRGRITQ
jgi:hypothetical protein